MKQLSIIFIAAFLTCCSNNSETSTSTAETKETEKKEEVRPIDNEVEMTILSTLKFYISETKGQQEIEKATQTLIDTTSDRKRYLVGEYKFRNIKPTYHNDSLYKVRIQGFAYSVNEISKFASKDVKRLNDVLSIKYGEPIIKNQLPTYFDKSYTYTIEQWNYRNKIIQTQVSPNEFGDWEVDLVIFRKEIPERLEREKKVKSQNAASQGAKNI